MRFNRGREKKPAHAECRGGDSDTDKRRKENSFRRLSRLTKQPKKNCGRRQPEIAGLKYAIKRKQG